MTGSEWICIGAIITFGYVIMYTVKKLAKQLRILEFVFEFRKYISVKFRIGLNQKTEQKQRSIVPQTVDASQNKRSPK